ncbi:MAG: hypothetical protein OEM02_10140 [Desulfobulbaceae bacterium]|nr:hypothetical protein [Desulfobulbaceae bacterium]
MRGKFTIAGLSALLFFHLFASSSYSCVGRLLVLAVGDTPDQVVMAEMLSLLVNERTGTSVELIKPGNLEACKEAVKQDKAQLFLNYVGVAQAEIGDAAVTGNPQEVYNIVRQHYLDSYDMVWLKPFGFNGPMDKNNKVEGGSSIAPVSTSEVLKRFPVLDRVINKLKNKVDDDTIADLVKKSKDKDVKDVVKEFLKSKKMI